MCSIISIIVSCIYSMTMVVCLFPFKATIIALTAQFCLVCVYFLSYKGRSLTMVWNKYYIWTKPTLAPMCFIL